MRTASRHRLVLLGLVLVGLLRAGLAAAQNPPEAVEYYATEARLRLSATASSRRSSMLSVRAEAEVSGRPKAIARPGSFPSGPHSYFAEGDEAYFATYWHHGRRSARASYWL
jgi:hypothetical protein